MAKLIPDALQINITESVHAALKEDVGSGDLTAKLLQEEAATAYILAKEAGVLCGSAWVNEVYKQLDQTITVLWALEDGDSFTAHTKVATLNGNVQPLLTGERVALNFLQTLSATASQTRKMVDLIKKSSVILLDTRKTIPSFRLAQKYAVKVGGGESHRFGLYDALLIKENHIKACGGIENTLKRARELYPNHSIEIEVESLEEYQQALKGKPDCIMLDNFKLEDLKKAVAQNIKPIKLEASGGISQENIIAIADTGVDYISMGALTKHIKAIDYSFLID